MQTVYNEKLSRHKYSYNYKCVVINVFASLLHIFLSLSVIIFDFIMATLDDIVGIFVCVLKIVECLVCCVEVSNIRWSLVCIFIISVNFTLYFSYDRSHSIVYLNFSCDLSSKEHSSVFYFGYHLVILN